MLYRCISAALVFFLGAGLALADHTGVITKYDDGKITIKTRGKKGDKGKEVTVKVASDVKISSRGKKGTEPKTLTVSELKERIKKGTKIGEKEIDGVFGTAKTKGEGDAEEVTEIIVGGGFGGKKGKEKSKD